VRPVRAQVEAWAAEVEAEVLLADGFDDALVGVAEVFTKHLAVYDRAACLRILQQRDGMTEEEAEEYFGFNVTGAYVGDLTPAFLVWRPDVPHSGPDGEPS
jgi:phage tail sheath protein FI